MLEGITVLSEEVITPSKFIGIIFIVLASILVVIGVSSIISMFFSGFDGGLLGISIVAMFVGVLILFVSICELKTPPYTQYKVTIDESVNFQDFYNNYKILNQDGKIYTIREK